MSDDTIPEEIIRALEVLGLTLPVTTEDLERAKRAQLYTWNPARYSNLTNNPKAYMEAVFSDPPGHIAETRALGRGDRVFEFMMNALRLTGREGTVLTDDDLGLLVIGRQHLWGGKDIRIGEVHQQIHERIAQALGERSEDKRQHEAGDNPAHHAPGTAASSRARSAAGVPRGTLAGSTLSSTGRGRTPALGAP